MEVPKIKFYFNTKYPSDLKVLTEIYPIISTKRSEKSWWKNMPSTWEVTDFQEKGWPESEQAPTIKYCPGIHDFINCGYTVPAWQDFEFFLEDNGNLKWRVPDTLNNSYIIEVHGEQQHRGCPMSDDTKALLKITSPWLIDTPEGYSTIFTKPFYDHPRGFDVCPGILDTDMKLKSNKQINVFIRIDKKNEVVRIDAGKPLLQLIPFKRTDFSYEICEPSEEFSSWMKKDELERASRFNNSAMVTDKDSLLKRRHKDNKNYEAS